MKYAVDLCCGKGRATQAFRDKPDWHVVGVDVDKRFYQQWQGKNVSFVLADVTAVDWSSFLEDVGIPRVDFLWASPPCTYFSLAHPYFPRKGMQKAMEIVGACFEAIATLKPRYWLVENPRGRLGKLSPIKPNMTIFYSDWDAKFPTQKPTCLWTNIPLGLASQFRRPIGKKNGLIIKAHKWEYAHKRDPIERAMVPLGVSEAVYQSVQQRLTVLSSGDLSHQERSPEETPST